MHHARAEVHGIVGTAGAVSKAAQNFHIILVAGEGIRWGHACFLAFFKHKRAARLTKLQPFARGPVDTLLQEKRGHRGFGQ
jgi:hypothetical protein